MKKQDLLLLAVVFVIGPLALYTSDVVRVLLPLFQKAALRLADSRQIFYGFGILWVAAKIAEIINKKEKRLSHRKLFYR